MPAGRPTEYREEYCEKIIEFFNRPLTQKQGGKVIGCELPQFSQFAREIGVHHVTMNRWVKEHEDFRIAYNEAKKIQESILVGNSIQNRYNPYFAQFMLKNCHDWSDKQEVEQNHSITLVVDDDDADL